MEGRIVNTTDTVDNPIFNRIEEGDDADHQLMYLSIRTYIENAINIIAEINYGPYPPVDAWRFYCDSDQADNATMDIMSVSYPTEELGMEFPYPFTLEVDNDTARIFANATAQRSKLKHIDCRQEWVKTLRNKNVCVHIPTKDNLADIFTKILPSGDFIRLRDQLLHPTHTN